METVEEGLTSNDPGLRAASCNKLSTLFRNAESSAMDNSLLVSRRVLTKYRACLLDGNMEVKLAASLAFSTITDLGDKTTAAKFTTLGLFSAAVGIVLAAARVEIDANMRAVVRNLLFGITNVLIAHSEAGTDIYRQHPSFVQLVFASFVGMEVRPSMLLALVTMANVLSKTACIALITVRDMQCLQTRFDLILDKQGKLPELSKESAADWLLLLKLLEIVLVYHIKGTDSRILVLAKATPYQAGLNLVLSVLQMAVDDPSNLLKPPPFVTIGSTEHLYALNLADVSHPNFVLLFVLTSVTGDG